MSAFQSSATTIVLEDIVTQVLAGQIRVPHFQRGLRWQWEDVRRLFDSIRKGYPIGSLLLWERPSPRQHFQLGALEIDALEGQAFWLVDGQQRVTSLANALSDEGQGDRRFALAFNVKTNDFSKPGKASDSHLIPLPALFDLPRLLKWFDEHKDLDREASWNHAAAAAKAIREFKIPAYVVSGQDEQVLRDIFDRMNNYGYRLSRAEVFSALHSAEGQALRLADIGPNIAARTGFGRIDDDTILRAILARRDPHVMREVRDEFNGSPRDVAPESEEAAYRRGEEALAGAIAFLQRDAGVPHFGFLPYRYLLVVLARFFAHFPKPKPRNVRLLKRWFWRAALAGPSIFRGWTQALDRLARLIEPRNETQSIQELLQAIRDRPFHRPQLERFRTNHSDSRVVLCALWSLQPRSPFTGKPFGDDALASVLRDESSASNAAFTFFPGFDGAAREWAANRALAFGEGFEDGWPSKPSGLTNAQWTKVLDSHALNESMVKSLENGNEREFLLARQKEIEKVVRTFLEQVTEQNFEDTPPLDELSLDESDAGEPDDDARQDSHASE